MKKQTEILTTTIWRPNAKKIELVFLVLIATVIYRNQSNRRLPAGMPPNTLGFAKQVLQSVVSESEKMVTKLASFFYNVTGESLTAVFQVLAIAGLLVFLVAAIVYI